DLPLTSLSILILLPLTFTLFPYTTLFRSDDHDVLYRSGTQRVAGIPTRHSENALVPSDKDWEMLIGYMSVYRNPQTGKYQLWYRSEEHTSELQSLRHLVCRLLLEKKKKYI